MQLLTLGGDCAQGILAVPGQPPGEQCSGKRATGAHMDWAGAKGFNQWERQALEPAEERKPVAAPVG